MLCVLSFFFVYNFLSYNNYPHVIKEKKGQKVLFLIPDFEEWIPGAGGDRQTVIGHAQTANPIVVAR